jgi:hypothetical protein
MAELTCPEGHRWSDENANDQTIESGLRCPTCGKVPAPAAGNEVDATFIDTNASASSIVDGALRSAAVSPKGYELLEALPEKPKRNPDPARAESTGRNRRRRCRRWRCCKT